MSRVTLISLFLSAVLLVIAAVHAYWGIGGVWPAGTEKDLARAVVGRPDIVRMPSRRACFLVAALVFLVSLWPLVALGAVPSPMPSWLHNLAGAGIAVLFTVRGLIAYLPAWRRLCPEMPFARLDRRVYGPLCLALGIGFLMILLTGPRT